jgi:hypothetical protein
MADSGYATSTAILTARERRRRAQEAARDRGFFTEGMRVVLVGEKGLTDPDVLETPFFFQHPPQESLSISASQAWNEVETIGGDTLSNPGASGLRAVGFTTLFLDWESTMAVHHRGGIADDVGIDDPNAPDYTGAFRSDPARATDRPIRRTVTAAPPRNPLVVANALRQIMESKTPFRLLIGQPQVWGRWDLSMLATLRTVDVREVAGEPDTRYADAAFTEFVRPELVRRKKKGRPQYHPKLPMTITVYKDGHAKGSDGHTIRKATDLRELAKLFYGSSSKWRLIVQANSALKGWGPGEDLDDWVKNRHKGNPQKLRIPKAQHSARHHSNGTGGARPG